MGGEEEPHTPITPTLSLWRVLPHIFLAEEGVVRGAGE